MRSFFRLIRVALITAALLPFYSSVLAQDAQPAELTTAQKPLAIIRFTETVVPYEGALKRAIAHTEASVPDTFYDVVSIYPQTSGYFNTQEEKAMSKAQSVVDIIKSEGVPESRIRLSKQASDAASFQEVHVFLR